MKVYIVMGNSGWHVHRTDPYSVHSTMEDAKFYHKCNKELNRNYFGHIEELELDKLIDFHILSQLAVLGIDIPDKYVEE